MKMPSILYLPKSKILSLFTIHSSLQIMNAVNNLCRVFMLFWLYCLSVANPLQCAPSEPHSPQTCKVQVHFKIKNNPYNIQVLQFSIGYSPSSIIKLDTLNKGPLLKPSFQCALGETIIKSYKKFVNCNTFTESDAIPAKANGEIAVINFTQTVNKNSISKISIQDVDAASSSSETFYAAEIPSLKFNFRNVTKPCEKHFDLVLDKFVTTKQQKTNKQHKQWMKKEKS